MTLENGARLVLLAAVGLWAVFLFGGFITGRANADQTHRTPRWARIASSLMLVIGAWVWWLAIRQAGSLLGLLPLYIAVGMSFGLLGDLFMAQLIPWGDRVVGGIAAFGLGHIAYTAGLITHGDQSGLDASAERWSALLFCLLLGAALWYFVVYRGSKAHTVLHLAALPYALLLASTTGFALGLALQDASFMLTAVGAALFLLSDLLLAAQLFNGLHFHLIGDVVWFLYGPGQMLIVYGLVFPAIL
jgi:hypothetical protein